MDKYLKYFLAILRGHLLNKRIPIQVTLCVTNRCNMRCVYCYEEYYSRNHPEFSTQRILELIDTLHSMGTKYVSINGGEALLRNDIGGIVNKIKLKGMLCHLSTNGTLVKNHLGTLRNVDSLAISIDGAKTKNDLNRGKGTYEKIYAGMELLYKEKINFHTNTVLTKNNINALGEVMNMAKKFGFKAQFSPLRKEDSLDKSIGFNDEEIKRVIEEILEYKKKKYPVFFSEKAYESYLDWPFSYDKQVLFEKIPYGYKAIECFIKKFACHIEANGFVYPCVVLVNKFPALNFLEVGFKRAWENLSNTKCTACNNICCNEHNLVFGLKPQAMNNAFNIVNERLKEKIYKK